jgi:hypothetical protein
MQSNYLQNVRYKLQKRIRRLNGARFNEFLFVMKQFLVFFESYPILNAVTDELLVKFPNVGADVDKLFQGQGLYGENEAESAAMGCEVLKRFAAQDDQLFYTRLGPVADVAEVDRQLDTFRQLYLEPFYEYLDEHLDDRNFILYCLERYKRTCEWFERGRLFQMWNAETQRGEKLLALDLYKYLFEQGVEFHIEPWSVSGEADMVATQASDNPLIADVKVFNPTKSKGKAYVIRALQQVHTYTCDYNQPLGYVVIFNTSASQLRFALTNPAQPVPRVLFNSKTVFFIVIDIFPRSEPASQRKILDVVEITEDELVGRQQS